jgi:hypothetical protein
LNRQQQVNGRGAVARFRIPAVSLKAIAQLGRLLLAKTQLPSRP